MAKVIRRLNRNAATGEELLPDFCQDFPYLATRAELDQYGEPWVPWHWHRVVELFYMESGSLEYVTPGGTWRFTAGSGGMVNSNVLHSTRFRSGATPNVQLLHLFDPSLLSGEPGSRIDARYVRPLLTSGVELIPLYPDCPENMALLRSIREGFALSEQDWGFEFRLRDHLSGIWLQLLRMVQAKPVPNPGQDSADGIIKALMLFIQEHQHQPISMEELAKTAHISQRSCFRIFQEKLHMSPHAYLQSCRLQSARKMLLEQDASVTRIAYDCGFCSASHFGKAFRTAFGCSPRAYRKLWQDFDKNRQ